jgi:hypothetical protein
MTNPSRTFKPRAFALAGLALLSVGALLALSSSASAAPTAGPMKECQHPLTTGQEAVNIKGVSPGAACKVVRSLAAWIGTSANGYKKLYECVGASAKKPGRPKLNADEFEGWKLSLVNGYGLRMSKPGASFRVTGTDFPINCS